MATQDWSFPDAEPNQQTVPADFDRMAAVIESVPARLAEHLFLDPTTEAPRGIVLWGLQVLDFSSQAHPRRIAVTRGAALLPGSAGNRGWHLALLSNDTIADLAAIDGGPRNDCIELGLTDLPDAFDNRKFRVWGPGGQAMEVRNVPTKRKPAGVVNVVQGGGANSSPGAVRLAQVALNGAGAIAAVTDLRTFMFTADAGAGADGHHRGLRGWVQYARGRLAELGVHEGRLDGHDDAIAALQAADAGHDAADATLAATVGTISPRAPKATVKVRLGANGWTWRGENVTAVERTTPDVTDGHWRIRVDAEAVPGLNAGDARYVAVATTAEFGDHSLVPSFANAWIETDAGVPWIHVETFYWQLESEPQDRPIRSAIAFGLQVYDVSGSGDWTPIP